MSILLFFMSSLQRLVTHSRRIMAFMGLAGLALLSHAQQQTPSSAAIHTVVSIKPLALFYRGLMVDVESENASLSVLLPVQQNPHDYQLSVNDIRLLQQADIFYWLGADKQPSIAKLATRMDQSAWHRLDKMPSHAWLSQAGVLVMIEQMAAALQADHPSAKSRIQHNHAVMVETINAAYTRWRQMLASYADSHVLLGHSAFMQFAYDIGLQHVELYRSGHSHGHQGAGMHDLMTIQQEIAAGEIRCAMAEPDIDFSKLKRRYPALRVGLLEPMANSITLSSNAYVEHIDASAQQFLECLRETN